MKTLRHFDIVQCKLHSVAGFFFCISLIILLASLSFPQSVRDEIKKIGGSPAYTGSWTPANLPIDTTSTSVYFYGEAPKTKVAKDSGGVSVRPYMRVWRGTDSTYGIDFDGLTENLAVNPPTNLGMSDTAYTIQFWAKLRTGGALIGNVAMRDYPFQNSVTEIGYVLKYSVIDKWINLQLNDSTTAYSDKIEISYDIGTQWRHYVFTINATFDTCWVYIDGELEATKAFSGLARPIEVYSPFNIGSQGGTANASSQIMGELQILKGTTLTASQVYDEYMSTDGFTAFSDAVLWYQWQYDDSIFVDISGTDNDATPTNLDESDRVFYEYGNLFDSTFGYVRQQPRLNDTTVWHYSQSVWWRQKDKDTIWLAAETDTVTVYPYVAPPVITNYLVFKDGSSKLVFKNATDAIKFED